VRIEKLGVKGDRHRDPPGKKKTEKTRPGNWKKNENTLPGKPQRSVASGSISIGGEGERIKQRSRGKGPSPVWCERVKGNRNWKKRNQSVDRQLHNVI